MYPACVHISKDPHLEQNDHKTGGVSKHIFVSERYSKQIHKDQDVGSRLVLLGGDVQTIMKLWPLMAVGTRVALELPPSHLFKIITIYIIIQRTILHRCAWKGDRPSRRFPNTNDRVGKHAVTTLWFTNHPRTKVQGHTWVAAIRDWLQR